MAMVTKRPVAMDTRVVGKDVGNGKGGKSGGKGGKSNGNGNKEGHCEEKGNERKRQTGEKGNLAAEKNLAAVASQHRQILAEKAKR
jgi:hypothetical protein